jgi:hypothetical protein
MKIIFSTLLLIAILTISSASKSQFKFADYKQPTSGNVFAQMQSKMRTSLRAGIQVESTSGQAPMPFYFLVNKNSNLCLALDTTGSNMYQKVCGSVANQKFMFLQTTFLTYIIMVVHSGNVIETVGILNDGNLLQTPLTGITQQQFLLGTTSPATCFNTIKNVVSGMCIETFGSSLLDGANVSQHTCSPPLDNQLWKLVPTF